jgi:predicted transcriptional regulator
MKRYQREEKPRTMTASQRRVDRQIKALKKDLDRVQKSNLVGVKPYFITGSR